MENIRETPMAQSYFRPFFISMFGIVVTSIAILAYHLFLVRYFRRRGEAAVEAAMRPSSGARAGVGKKVLETIPIFPFSALKRNTDQGEECVVCLGEIEDEEMVRLLPNCKHAFHVTCVDRWLAAHVTCPLCRSPILEVVVDQEKQSSPPPNDRTAAAETLRESGVPSTRSEPSSPRTETDSPGFLRHCTSLLMSSPAPPRLKRSLSMDILIINLNHTIDTSSSSSLTRSESSGTRALSRVDRAPSKWFRNFSRWRCNGSILPY